MKNWIIIVLLIAFVTLLIVCNSGEKIEGYSTDEILVVKLDIDDDLAIEKITLKSTYSEYKDSILKHEIGNRKTIKLKCPQKGEGEFSICVYTKTDTLCSQESYIEGGYRPRIELKNKIFKIKRWF